MKGKKKTILNRFSDFTFLSFLFFLFIHSGLISETTTLLSVKLNGLRRLDGGARVYSQRRVQNVGCHICSKSS